MPAPCSGHDGRQLGKLRLPAEFAAGSICCGHQDGWIARPARALLDGNALAGHFLRDPDHLANTIAPARAEVVGRAVTWPQLLQGSEVARSPGH